MNDELGKFEALGVNPDTEKDVREDRLVIPIKEPTEAYTRGLNEESELQKDRTTVIPLTGDEDADEDTPLSKTA